MGDLGVLTLDSSGSWLAHPRLRGGDHFSLVPARLNCHPFVAACLTRSLHRGTARSACLLQVPCCTAVDACMVYHLAPNASCRSSPRPLLLTRLVHPCRNPAAPPFILFLYSPTQNADGQTVLQFYGLSMDKWAYFGIVWAFFAFFFCATWATLQFKTFSLR